MLKVDINLLGTILNVLIIFFIVVRFLLKPVNKILDQRAEEIEKIYAKAGETAKEAQELKASYEQSLADIDGEKSRIISESRSKAGEEYHRIVETAKIKADKLVEQAQDKAKKEKSRYIQQAQAQIADMVLEATAKLVAEQKGEQRDRELFNQFLDATQQGKSGE